MIEFNEVPSSQIKPVTGYIPIKEYSDIYNYFENYFYKLGYEYLKAFKTSTTLSTKENNIGKLLFEILSILEINLKENLKGKNENSDSLFILSEYFAIAKKLLKTLEINKIKLDENLISSTILGYLITKLK